MAPYSRSVEHQSRVTDEIWGLLQGWFASFCLHKDSVTVGELMRANNGRLKDANTVLAAAYLLEEEGKIRLETSTGHRDHRDSITIYALPY
jgi:hypothetical protein